MIFVGLPTLTLGIASRDETRIGGWSLTVFGILADGAGEVLIVVRSHGGEPPLTSSSQKEKGKK